MTNQKNIKVISRINEKDFLDDTVYIFTHDGIFHGDEIAAAIIYAEAQGYEKIVIIRTHDDAQLKLAEGKKNAIVVDIGLGKYDHHGTEKKLRDRNEKNAELKPADYASAGLVWRDYGNDYIKNVLSQMDISIEEKVKLLEDNSFIKLLHEKIDEEIIQPIDAFDNGDRKFTPKRQISEFYKASFYEDFYPSYLDDNPDFNVAFLNLLKIYAQIINYEVKSIISENLKQSIKEFNILEIQDIMSKDDYKTEGNKRIESVNANKKKYNLEANFTVPKETILNLYYDYVKYGASVLTDVLNAKINRGRDEFIAIPFLGKRTENKELFNETYGILEIPTQTTPWKNFAWRYNEKKPKHPINFVLYPYPRGGWALECVSPSEKDKFGKRIELNGETQIQLEKLHGNLFFAQDYAFNAKEKLIQLAIESYEKTKIPSTPPISGVR